MTHQTAGARERGALALPDKAMMIEAVKLLHPGRVVELRMLNLDGRGQTASGYFDQPALLAEAALRCNRRAEGVYITLNPIPAEMLSRKHNEVSERARDTTKDSEVQRRAWFPIDLDPTRLSGISSSEDEHQAALEQARRVREWLASEWGWHAPLFADSGNGAHLLYAIDLPNDAASADLLKRCLAALASCFDTEAVKLDRSVYNAARIWKLYGSVARKGEHRPQRPHRLAQIINAPDPLEPITREQLLALAGMPPGTATVQGSGAALGMPADAPTGEDEAMLAWLETHGAKVLRTKRDGERIIYVLERCPFADHHAPGKACVTRFESGALAFTCHAAGCADYHWRDLLARWDDAPPRAPAADAAAGDDDTPDAPGEDDGNPSGFGGAAPSAEFIRRSADDDDTPDEEQQDADDDTPAGEEQDAPAGGTAAAEMSGRAQVLGGERPWPEDTPGIIYQGLAGDIVRAIQPHTEADPLAILVQLLTAFGAAIGPGPHFNVGPTRHQPRLFSVIVGKSAKARKGDSWQGVREVVERSGVAPRLQTSLSSGEGLIWMVRDPIIRTRLVPGKGGQQDHYEQLVEDEGESEKRVLVVSGEMAQIFKVLRREGNTLSAIIRDAWDQGNLSIATRSLAARATGAYLSLIGHITEDELRKEMNSLDAANGFANRFCWFAVRRSQELPDPDALDEAQLAALASRFRQAVEQARAIGRMRRDTWASMKWNKMYRELTIERGGFAGALISRSEAQVLRLSMLYALLDGSPIITLPHLWAATELWSYAERSIDYLFGGLAVNPLAERIAGFLKEHGELKLRELHDLVHHNASGDAIDKALKELAAQGRAVSEKRKTRGRSATIWRLVTD